MFRYINKKRIIVIVMSGFILANTTACKSIKIEGAVDRGNYSSYKKQEAIKVQEVKHESLPIDAKEKDDALEKENEVIKKIEEIDATIDSYISADNFEKVKNKARDMAITIIDFAFYDKPINGITFKELSDSGKKKVLDLVSKIDSKVEQKWPNYKDTVKDKFGQAYSVVKDKIQQGTAYVDSKLEEKIGTEKYNDYKDIAKDLASQAKDDIKEAYDVTKVVVGKGFSKVKSWYESKR